MWCSVTAMLIASYSHLLSKHEHEKFAHSMSMQPCQEKSLAMLLGPAMGMDGFLQTCSDRNRHLGSMLPPTLGVVQ